MPSYHRAAHLACLFALLALLAACGQKGPLYLAKPEPTAPPAATEETERPGSPAE